MPIIGTLLKKGIKLRETLEQDYTSPYELQKKELSKLLISARNTQFGRANHFFDILESFRSFGGHEFFEHFKAASHESVPDQSGLGTVTRLAV